MIRQAELKDLNTIDDIAKATIASMQKLHRTQWSFSYPRKPHFKADVEARHLYVFEEENTIKAMMAIYEENEASYRSIAWHGKRGMVIHRLMVHPDYQGQGIADSLILFGIGKTKEQGFESLKIDTHAANGPMRKLLKKHQFEPRGYIKAIDRLAYERRIDYRFAHRILIFGNAGTGKTTLARMLGEKLQLDVIHLDTIYWLKNWQSLSKPDFNKAVLSYLKQHPRFVMDGNYTNHTNFEDRLKISDTVILLNYHEKTALKGVIERENVYKHRYRSDMATGCIEELDQEFLQYVAFFEPKRHKLEAIINSLRPKKNILVFDTREALMHWYNSL